MSSDFAFSELTPVSFLRRAAAVFGDRTAIVDGDFSCTYHDFWLRARQSADLLASAGVKPGDRVAILAPNSHLLLEAHYGVPLSGGVLVALNSRLAPAELAYILEHSGARILLVDNEFAASAEAATNMLDDPPTVIGSEAHEQALTGRPPLEVPVTDERALLSINYTSGTTGRPKGVMYHHRGAYLQALAMALHAKLDVGSRVPVDAADVPLQRLVLSAGRSPLPAASTCACAPRPTADLEHDARVGRHPFLRGADGADDAGADGTRGRRTQPRVRCISHGGAPPTPALLERLARARHRRQHLYGLTETFGPAVVSNGAAEWVASAPTSRARPKSLPARASAT